jgi:hypothetical protein
MMHDHPPMSLLYGAISVVRIFANAWLNAISAVILAAALLPTAVAHGAFVNLSIDASFPIDGIGTWTVYAAVSGSDNVGLASFSLDVIGQSGVTITSSVNRAPIALTTASPPHLGGFSVSRSGGVGGIAISALQPFTSPSQDEPVFEGVGITGGSADFSSNGGTATSWNSPVLIASGAYSAVSIGSITANVHPGAFFQVLERVDGEHWVGPGNVLSASVNPAFFTFPPEPPPDMPEVNGAVSGLIVLAGRLLQRKRAGVQHVLNHSQNRSAG